MRIQSDNSGIMKIKGTVHSFHGNAFLLSGAVVYVPFASQLPTSLRIFFFSLLRETANDSKSDVSEIQRHTKWDRLAVQLAS
jgi:hypothetical protein